MRQRLKLSVFLLVCIVSVLCTEVYVKAGTSYGSIGDSYNYTMTDIRDANSTKEFDSTSGKYSVIVMGKVTSCYNTHKIVSELNGVYSYVNEDDVDVYFIDISDVTDEGAEVVSKLNELGLSDKIMATNTTVDTNAQSLYYRCANLAGLSSYTMPFIAYINSLGEMFAYSTGYVELVDIMSALSEGGLTNSYDENAGYMQLSITGSKDYASAYAVLERVNEERAAVGLSALVMDEDLLGAAMERAAEIALCYRSDHTRPTGKLCFSISEKMEAENIAAGQMSAASVMDAWMNSEGHRANILTDGFTSIGVGVFYYDGVYYWAQAFGSTDLKEAPESTSVLSATYDIYASTDCVTLSLTGEKSLEAGDTTKLTITTQPNVIYKYATINPESFTWTSDSTAVTVDKIGNVTAVSSGSATITATNKALPEYKLTHEITITGGEEPEDTIPNDATGIPDPNLYQGIVDAYDSNHDNKVQESELVYVTALFLDNKEITDLTGIEYCKRVCELHLSNNNITDITPLSGLNVLTYVDVSCNKIKDLSPLSGKYSIVTISAYDNEITEIGPLENMLNLSNLYLEQNNITDISPLAGFTNLVRVGLDYNNITNISALAGLNKIKELNLKNNRISDVSPLAGLSNLEELRLSNNLVSDIKALKNLSKLNVLILDGNNISDISALKDMQLQALVLRNNKIKSLDDLKGGKLIDYIKERATNKYVYLATYINGNYNVSYTFGEGNQITKANAKEVLPKELINYPVTKFNENTFGYEPTGEIWFDKEGFIEKQIPAKNGLQLADDGNWYYYVDGVVQTDFSGLYCDENVGWWLVENGAINFNYNGLYGDANYGWWLVQGGAISFGYNGLYCDANCGWWLVENGTVSFGYNGLYCDANCGWWLVEGGAISFDYNGLYCDANCGWWLVEGGTISFGFNGLYCDASCGWWLVEGGTISFGYSGLYCDANYGWWLVQGGTISFGYTGLAYDPVVGWWYVEGGAINFGYTGTVEYNGGVFNVVNGMVVF